MKEKTDISEDYFSFLTTHELLSAESAQRARAAYDATTQPVDTVLRELALMPEEQIAKSLASFCGCNLHSDIDDIDEELLASLGSEFAQEHAIVPSYRDNRHTLTVANPFDRSIIDAIAYFIDSPIEISVAPRSLIDQFFREQAQEQHGANISDHPNDADDDDVDRLLDSAREAPVVKFVSQILRRAVDEMATDIHIEPFEDSIRIRFRKDGLLVNVEVAPKAISAGVISRIKILSRLNISERRLPQDGRLRLSVRGQDVDFRVSIMPSIYGETIVLRILDRSNVRLDLQSLGFSSKSVAAIQNMVRYPNGIVLLTGPTGSGKTTTLYSILMYLNEVKSKIFTVEDPVEYRLTGITQLQVDSSAGLNFAAALRSVLRQDPDIILVGEIRDAETARIAIQAALTGHLVLSTLHTNNASGAINRLRDMGIEDYLLSSTLRGVIGQRLVRKRCTDCLNAEEPSNCKTCQGSGYSGRCAVYEIMEVSDKLKDAIGRHVTQSEIEVLAVKEGMQPVAQYAQSLVDTGITTEAEVARVIELQGE